MPCCGRRSQSLSFHHPALAVHIYTSALFIFPPECPAFLAGSAHHQGWHSANLWNSKPAHFGGKRFCIAMARKCMEQMAWTHIYSTAEKQKDHFRCLLFWFQSVKASNLSHKNTSSSRVNVCLHACVCCHP